MTRRLAAGLVVLAAVMGPTRADTACPAEAEGFRRLKTAEAEIAYRWEPGELRVGQFFTAEVVACRVPGPEPVGQIALDATMPAHGHGMNYRPKAEPTGAGRYRFTGLMLHMPGTWRFTFDLFQGSRRTRVSHDLSLNR
jgi:YtkA-like